MDDGAIWNDVAVAAKPKRSASREVTSFLVVEIILRTISKGFMNGTTFFRLQNVLVVCLIVQGYIESNRW